MPAADPRIAPIMILQERSEARAILYHLGEYQSFADAVMPLIRYAERVKMNPNIAISIIDKAFEA